MTERVQRRPPLVPRPSMPSDEELLARLRTSPPSATDSNHPDRDELLARLGERLRRYFREMASSRGYDRNGGELAEDLAHETILRVLSARPNFLLERDNPFGYAFRAAGNVWASHARAEAMRRVRHAQLPAEPDAPSPWDRLEQAETEADWERRVRLGERLRAAEEDCATQLAQTRPPPRGSPDMHTLVAALWLWCSHARGSAAAFYAGAKAAGRNTTRDLDRAEPFMRACLTGRGFDPGLVDALCRHVRLRAGGKHD